MSSRLSLRLVVLGVLGALVALPASLALASPADSKPGDVRVTYGKGGTVLHADALATSAPVGSVPAGTSVTVLEVKLPWIRVQAGDKAGWVKAYETIEPAALASSGAPPYQTGVGEGSVSSREVSAAGRQFSDATERDYRASRQDLAAAYERVNEMERATATMDATDSIAFIYDGSLSRRGRNLARPGRTPPDPEPSDKPDDGGKGFDPSKLDPNKIPGLGKLFGGKKAPSGLGTVLKIGAAGWKAKHQMESMAQAFTPTQEYYLGRAIAANAIAKYGIDRDESRRRYVRLVGDTLVRVCDAQPAWVPPNHGGYHFDVLDCPDINAISGPGGFVLITRGAVDAARDEDELAGILAHELSHVVLKHGERVLRQGQMFEARRKAILEFILTATDANGIAAQITEFFGQSVGELVNTSAGHAYGSALEFEADRQGTFFLNEALYDPGAIRDELRYFGATGKLASGADHAPPMVRAQQLDGVIPALQGPFSSAEDRSTRTQRFGAALHRAVARPPAPPTPPLVNGAPAGGSGSPPPPPVSNGAPAPSTGGMPPPPPPPIPLPR